MLHKTYGIIIGETKKKLFVKILKKSTRMRALIQNFI